jgi:SAM-dependent methyltransferase
MSLQNDIDLPPSTDVGFWEHYYHEPEIPWDLGEAAPPFILDWLKQHPDFFEKQKIQNAVVFGAGAGHDAALFAQNNLTVTGLDYAPSAIEMATKLYGHLPNLTFLQADCLNLANSPLANSLNHSFHLAIEHTFFCAIQPDQRDTYIENLRFALKPKGYVLGLFWNHGNSGSGGPPFDTTTDDIQKHFEPYFQILSLEEAKHPHPRRQNKEWLGLFQLKP